MTNVSPYHLLSCPARCIVTPSRRSIGGLRKLFPKRGDPSYVFEEFGQRHLQRLSDSIHHRERDVLLAPLDGSHVAPVEVALVGEPLLGESALPAQLRDPFSKFFMDLLHFSAFSV